MFFLFILLITLLLGVMAFTSRIGIEIENLIIDTEKNKGEKINKDSKIYLYILIFNKIKLFKKDVKNYNEVKIKDKILNSKFLKKQNFKIEYMELLKNIDIDVKEIDLNIQIATENAALTAILTGIISIILGVTLKKPKYEVIPIYSYKNFLKIRLNGIFSIYLMQYIYKLIYNKIKNLGNENLKKKVEV